MAALDYQLVDFDNHYYEPEDAFTRHGDDEVQRFVRWVSDGKKRHLTLRQRQGRGDPEPDVQSDRQARRLPPAAEGAQGQR